MVFDEEKLSYEKSFLEPLIKDAPAMVRQIINWSPTITDSLLGLKTDDDRMTTIKKPSAQKEGWRP